ncbi:hypothetical protein BZA70DRAFT_21360 [Myxozyma melibiosi]|uniref:Xylanolytic transcriptional activator regulatory domain-containing protein n=1 Tax=Myxozyma melibiosi TaxID=54550 RepID=A0ABR1FCU1_9ASCO
MHSNLMAAVYSQISTAGQTLDVSADTFYRYLQTYQQYPGYQQPILHHTLFSSYAHLKDFETATDHVERCVVLLFCAAIGAIYCSEPTTARKMRDVAKTALAQLLGQNSFKWEKAEDVESVLHVLQARLLCAVFDAWSGDRELVEMALNEQLLWIRMCTKCTLSKFRRVTSDWRRWIVRESFHRVYWGCFSLISDFNMAYGDITPEPVVSTRLFPLPEADALWDAEDPSSWQQQIRVCEAPLTADVIIAKIVGEVEAGGHQRARESRFCEASAFATCVLLRFVMHHVSASEQVFNSQVLSKGLDPECEKITQYLRQLSGQQIDRLLADLSIRSMKFTHSPTKFSIESLIQSIELRRRRLVTSKKLGVLCSILIESDRNQILGDFLSSKTMKSEQVCQAVTICLKYIEPYAVSGTRMRTFKELVCTWESVLLIIMWLRTMVNAGVHTETERSAVEQVKQTVAKFPAEAGVVEDGTAELARRMARVWRRVLQETQSYGTSYMMLQFFDQLADLL